MGSYNRFGMTEEAFGSDSDPKFFVNCETHSRALAHLRHGLKQSDGIVVLTGEAGIGKTTILERAHHDANSDHLQVVMLDANSIDESDLEASVLDATGLSVPGEDTNLVDVLIEQRSVGKNFAVFIDNAEALSDDGLAAVRSLSSMYHDGDALLSVALAGDTPMRSILYKANMDRLRQRIIASYHIPSLSKDQVETYVRHRVGAAGGDAKTVFSDAAIEALTKHSNGAPGKINKLATAAIELAHARGNDHVAGKDVQAAAKSIDVGAPLTPAPEKAAAPQSTPPTAPPQAASATPETKETPTVARAVIPTSPIERINGAATRVQAPKTAAPTPADINSAIVKIGGDAPPAPTQQVPPTAPQKRRSLSPQELMRPSPSSNLATPTAPAPVARKEPVEPAKPQTPATIGVKLPAAPVPEGDLWDPAAPMSDAEAARVKNVDLNSVHGSGEAPAPIFDFLAETREKLDRLRASVERIREETDRLDSRRRETREKLGGRLEHIRSTLDKVRTEQA